MRLSEMLSGVVRRARLSRSLANRWLPLYLVIFAAFLIIQLFLPPSVGLSDNGDFTRLTHDLHITPNYPPTEHFFRFFTPDYLWPDPRIVWARELRCTGRLAVFAAAWLAHLKPAGHFDVRWLGFVHLCVFVLCFGFFLRLLRAGNALEQWLLPPAAIWIYTDTFYADYLNSFYLDAMGFLCFLLAAVGLFGVLQRHPPRWAFALYLIGSVGFGFSKPLNAAIAVLLGASVAVSAGFLMRGVQRMAASGSSVCCSLAGLTLIAATPPNYENPALLDVVMMQIATSPEGSSSLNEFGLVPSDMQYAGMDAFRPGGPSSDPAFLARFEPHALAHLLRWYVEHPRNTAHFLWRNLLCQAPTLRPLRDVEKQFQIPDSRSRSLCSWSDLRARMLHGWPYLTPLLYLAATLLAIAPWTRMRWQAYRGFGCFVGVVVLQGVLQFAAGALLDATETPRHLFMFHVCTDILILTLLGGALFVATTLPQAGWPGSPGWYFRTMGRHRNAPFPLP